MLLSHCLLHIHLLQLGKGTAASSPAMSSFLQKFLSSLELSVCLGQLSDTAEAAGREAKRFSSRLGLEPREMENLSRQLGRGFGSRMSSQLCGESGDLICETQPQLFPWAGAILHLAEGTA